MSQAKPFSISKKIVWKAYERVKANQGAAGVDAESIEVFEQDLKNNLYKIWNRMSSGTYFPPPVRTVVIPKKDGGGRVCQVVEKFSASSAGIVMRPTPPSSPAPYRDSQPAL